MKRTLSSSLKYFAPALLILFTTYVLVQVAVTSLENENQNKLAALSGLVQQKINNNPQIPAELLSSDLPRLEQELQPYLDEVVSVAPGLGASVYLPDLERVVAFSPRSALVRDLSTKAKMNTGTQEAYDTKQPVYFTVFANLRNQNVYNYAVPLQAGGKVVAILHFNQTADTVSKQIRKIWLSGAIVCLISLLFLTAVLISNQRRDQSLQQEQANLVQWLKNSIGGDFSPTLLDPNLTQLKDLPAEFAKAIDLVQFERKQKHRVLSQLPLGIMTFDARGKVRYINPYFSKLIGFSAEELRSWNKEEWRSHYRMHNGQHISDIFVHGDTMENCMGVLIRKDGEELPFALTMRHLKNEEGELVGYLAFCDDLSQEFALDRLTQKTHYIFNSIPLSVIIVDAEQRINYINPAVCQLFGQSEQDLISKALHSALPLEFPNEKPNLPDQVQKVLNLGMRSRLANIHRTVHGRECDLEFDLFPILNPYTSEADGCMVLIKDKTLYREWEQLSQRVDANSNYVQMAATIAHEVRNPMTSLRGFLQLLSQQLEGEQQLLYLDVMQTEIDRMNAILSEYLGMARTPHLQWERLNLSELVRETFLLLEGEANYRGTAINLDIAEGCEIDGLSRDLKQVLINLVRNGFDATESKGGLISIQLRDTGFCYELHVSDNGCGIPEEQQARIFEPFFTTKAMGTGLGLPVCKKIVDSHEGSLSVTSKLGAGTRFTMVLPKPLA